MMKRSPSSTWAFIFAALLFLRALPNQAFVLVSETPGRETRRRRNVALFLAGQNDSNRSDDKKKPLLITKEQKEHLDKFGPNPEIVGEIFFDKLTSAPDFITNALPGKWKDLVVNFKEMRKDDQKIKAERLERQKARDDERKARRQVEKPAIEIPVDEGGHYDVPAAS